MSRQTIQIALLLLAGGWIALSQGFVSSNDGSHVALGRALLRGETQIASEIGLTLRVDYARRNGGLYSDRPPGTAFFALPALFVGRLLDPPLSRATLARRRVLVAPATPRYAGTYKARTRHARPLFRYQGTRLALAAHTALVGVVGLLCMLALLARRGVTEHGRLFAVTAIGAATLWGPYSTMLFSHVTSATLLAATALGAERAGDDLPLLSPSSAAWRRTVASLTSGFCAAAAITSDYSLATAAPLLAALALPFTIQTWAAAALGAVPPLAAALFYHRAAFGSPLAIGYDFHASFRFIHQRSSTFGGHPLTGFWTLWGGGGGGAGLLAQSPVTLVGLVYAAREPTARRWLFALAPWLLLLLFYQMPGGGGTSDHRFLIPLLPFVGVGLGLAWQALSGRPAWLRAAIVALTVFSAAHVWLHFFSWRGW